MTRKASLIIAFYNNTQALGLIFKALSAQSCMDFEVVIADDGSKEDAVTWLEEQKNQVPFALKSVWHEDKGFRKNRILNHAVLAAESEYLIFIDGDCIPEKHFIEDHINNAQRGSVLSGRRVELPELFTPLMQACENPETFFSQHKWQIFRQYLFTSPDAETKGRCNRGRHVEKGIRLPYAWQQKLIGGFKPAGILGCNFSLYKSDLLKVNGFDMRYEAPAVGEDSDLDYRLGLIGITTRVLKGLAIQLHIYHPWLSRTSPNYELFLDTMEHKRSWAEQGIDTLKEHQ
ncbi:putative glycosyl transferase [Vibrio vulnificus YJ016]|uniref:Putative glycosyl transferase n=1 Tax=Vibrio vulnificus (strain YJ016) TaxID=196600 RepID=Q7MPR3_VIBVY|nr:glycosyltransferase family 2 protein [Vibrio vulnificus]PWY33650.1 glycosyl transferase [Vibrio vulnificus]BAC93063.1 putative glycosyl transferase [Vibrio vulnificus YJ016]HAS6025508.1 glycosyltransferase [Vibrio vulnificus]HAS6035292.1 glycosyltransferase [Vibrio vulnificus]HDY8018466.1 glycosyltransferase family 2 protein [Vibrio vulnificus]